MEETTFKGTCTLEDKGAREWLSILENRINIINERTKSHTLDIKKLEKAQQKK